MFLCTYDFFNILRTLYEYIGSPTIFKVASKKENGEIYSDWKIYFNETEEWLQNIVSYSKFLIYDKELEDVLIIKRINTFDDIPSEAYPLLIKFIIGEIIGCIPYKYRTHTNILDKLKYVLTNFSIYFDIDEFLFSYLKAIGFNIVAIISDRSILIQMFHINSGHRGLHYQ